jgi:hypothetical protein
MKTLCFLLLFTGLVFAIDFPAATIHSVYQKFQSNKPKDMADSAYIPTQAEGYFFRTMAVYLGESRAITGDDRQGMVFLEGMLGFKNILRMYKTEIHVKDSDSLDYWIPIQSNKMAALQKKCPGKCKVELNLIWSLNFHAHPFVIISDFNIR